MSIRIQHALKAGLWLLAACQPLTALADGTVYSVPDTGTWTEVTIDTNNAAAGPDDAFDFSLYLKGKNEDALPAKMLEIVEENRGNWLDTAGLKEYVEASQETKDAITKLVEDGVAEEVNFNELGTKAIVKVRANRACRRIPSSPLHHCSLLPPRTEHRRTGRQAIPSRHQEMDPPRRQKP